MDVLNQIQDRINTLAFDLRAEVVMASIMEELSAKEKIDFYINPLSQFQRSYRKDIVNSEIVDFDYDAKQFLKVNISRDGIYDTLPEGILHDRNYNRKDISADEMAKHYQERKKEEENGRLFFLPFENELFGHALDREQNEKQFLYNLNGENPIDFMFDFWGIQRNLPQHLQAKFIRLIPYMYEIVGNIAQTEVCLSYLLNEEIKIVQLDYTDRTSNENGTYLGENRLGIDFVNGSSYLDHTVNMEVVIGPIQNSEIKSYMEGGEIKKFLDIFYEYIFPIEIDIKTTILLSQEKEEFKVDELHKPLLGITTRI